MNPTRSGSTMTLAAIAWITVGMATAHADTLDWTGSNGLSHNWTSNWTSDGAHTYPQAGDLARMTKTGIDSWTYITLTATQSVGSMSARPNWGQYRINASGGARTLNFNNSGTDSVITVSHQQNSSSYTGILGFGRDGDTLSVNLANNLLINNDGTRNSHGSLAFDSKSTLTGGTVSDRRTITLQALGSSKITTTIAGAATFVGDWIVDGANATLKMNANSFGNASNSVTLKNGGVLDVDTLGAFSWTRALHGTGTVKATGGFIVDGGSFNITGLDMIVDLLSFTGSLTLNGDSTLNVTGAIAPGDYTIISSTAGITGTFGAENLDPGMSLSYDANSITLHVIPEPGTLALLAAAGVCLAPRRRRA